MLYREKIAVCSEIHTKHINTVCGQNAELLYVKLAVHTRIVATGGTYSDHWGFRRKRKLTAHSVSLTCPFPSKKDTHVFAHFL